MPAYESPSFYIDFSRLPPPTVIETIEYEKLVQIYRDRVVATNPALAQAVKLEQSPTNIILEAEAYGEMLVRARINAAARAVMLPFATGADLDVLAAFYNVARLPLVSTPRSLTTNPEDWESDARFRNRVQLAPEAFSTAGTAGSYLFHAKSADVTIKDVSITKMNDRGGLRIAVMNTGEKPEATPAQIEAVTKKLFSKNIKPLTDVLSISSVKVKYIDVEAELTLYPGPDAGLVIADAYKALDKLRARINAIGFDLTRSSLTTAFNQEGVQNVKIISPSQDVVVDSDACVYIRSAKITTDTFRRE